MRFFRSKADPESAAKAAAAKKLSLLSTDPKPGFLGNLTPSQYEKLLAFRELFTDKIVDFVESSSPIIYSETEKLCVIKSVPKNDSPRSVPESVSIQNPSSLNVTDFTETDLFLLRFLRARQFDFIKSSLMLNEYIRWRAAFHVDEICEVVRFPWIMELRSIYPHGYHGVDRIGRPVYIERIGKSDIAAVLKLGTLNHLLAYWVQQYEYLRRVILPACSIAAGRRIEQGVSILDLSGMGFSHVSNKSRHVMKELAKLSQDYFPEMLGCMIVVNAPSAFAPVWVFAKSLLDEATVSKITLMTQRNTHWKEYLNTLIEADQLPEFLGGTAPDQGWDSNSKGPWKDPKILQQLIDRYPKLSPNFIKLDVFESNRESLKYLDCVALVSSTPDEEDGPLQTTTGTQQQLDIENDALQDDEIENLKNA